MMSDKKRKRGRPRVAPVLSYGSEQKLRHNSQRTIKKPKYLKDQEEEDNLSRSSTPPPAARSVDSSRGSLNGNKVKNPRGYNPNVDDKESEYHYGSDFELEDDDPDAEKVANGENSRTSSDSTSENGLSDLDELMTDGLGESHAEGADFVPFWQLGPAGTLGVRASTPVPVWLQEREYPELILPKSSDDLLLPLPFLFAAVGIYEILRHFKHLVRLSPFYFENFCAALIAPEQSNLLIEIHIALTKALIREEDSQQTHFGTLDQKDSLNISLYFVDNLTWPETLRQYLFCDKVFKPILNILNSCNYPFTSLSNRLDVLKFLCDQFLQTSVVRNFLLRDGKILYDDHCRTCYKPGDLLCCDSCNAVYHLDCVEPPITSSPSEIEDWTCVICNAEKIEGVSDCLSLMESSGIMSRQEPIGYDRHGRKYWFLARRIFVECVDGDISYYSTTKHFELLMALIDKDDLEQSLYDAFEEFKDDIKRQMAITEKLTDDAKGNKMDEITLELEEAEIKFEELQNKSDIKTEEAYDTSIKQEKNDQSEDPASEVVPKIEKDSKMDNEFKKEITDVKTEKNTSKFDEKPRKVWDEITLKGLIKTKIHQFHHNNNSSPFRLGCDNSYRGYVNLYTTNTLALNKTQHNEERDKKRQLSHKFSLTNGSDFKWSGATHGSKDNQISTVRHTLCNLEQNIASHFFHPHWQNIRKAWVLSVNCSSDPNQFAKAMMLLVACIKPVVYLTAWHESLGHIRFKRITALDREERKKQEKREKKESDDESKLFPFVKYPKLPKHQLWKTKGEEYRMHGLWGWQWLASHRKMRSQSMYEVGLRSGPDKLCLPIVSNEPNAIKTLAVSTESYKIISSKNRHLQFSLLSPIQRREEEKLKGLDGVPVQTDFVVSGSSGIHQSLKVSEIDLEDHFEDGIVPVAKALSNHNRILYPKIAKASSLDSLLARRLTLKLQEERDLEKKKSAKSEDDSNSLINMENDDSEATETDLSDNENVEELPDSQRMMLNSQGPTATLLKEIHTYKTKYETLDNVDSHLPCYSSTCRKAGRPSCFSPSCILKEKIKQKLIMTMKNYKIVSGKHAPFEVIGSFEPIRVKDLDKSPAKQSKKKHSAASAVNDSVLSNHIDVVNDSTELKVTGDDDCSRSSVGSDNKDKDRIYSSKNTSGVIYLKKSATDVKSARKTSSVIPQLSSFKVNSKGVDKIPASQQNFFILPAYELRTLARKGGRYTCSGFNQNAKTNNYTWPYPSARPVFKLTWLYKTMTVPTISAAAYQIRILWACLRWDDMHEKGPLDGRKQVTTDAEIVQTEILKRKHSGRFFEKTEYLRRKVTIPLDAPKTVREFTPSQRSGLRKRRRAHSPVNKQPESLEEWVDEEKLDLWEIRSFGQRLEKAAMMSKKAAADKESLTTITRSISPSDFKAKMEEQMKIQRASYHQKKNLEQVRSPNIIKVAIGNAISNPIGTTKVILGGTSIITQGSKLPISSLISNKKIVTTKGGKIVAVQTSGGGTSLNTSNACQRFTIGKNASVFPVSSLPKVQVTSQGNKIIKLQSISMGNQRTILPRSTTSSANPVSVIRPITVNTTTTATTSIRPQNNAQPIQFVRLADGQLQLKSMSNVQQFQIMNTKSGGSPQLGLTSQTPIQVTQQLKTVTGLKGLSSGQIVKINGQQVLLRSNLDGNKTLLSNEAKIITAQGNLKAIKTSEGYALKAISPDNTPTTVSKEKRLSDVTSPPSSKLSINSSSTLTLRVQVRMTEQGPKTIIQGLQPGAGLTKDHIMAIQQQVRTMLSKYNLRVNQLSPLMTITLNTGGGQKSREITSKAPDVTTARQISPANISPSKFLTDESKEDVSPLKKIISPPKSKTFVASLTSPVSQLSTHLVTTPDKSKEFLNNNELHQQNKSNLEEFKDITSQGSKRKMAKDDNDWESNSPDNRSKTKRAKVDRSKPVFPTKVERTKVGYATKVQAQERKKKILKQQKLDSMLSKLKDLLKKDILKKRALLEKELQIQIHKDLAVAKQQMHAIEKLKLTDNFASSKRKLDTSANSQIGGTKESRSGRKMDSSSSQQSASVPSHHLKLASKISAGAKAKKSNKLKNKKIVCICRTPFDDTKFYVGCDLCGNWFHGECVGITEALSRSMTEYVCDDCTNAKLNKDLYCFCRQPYDETQFYICCERCEDWFHGKCIGIMQSEADDIDDYICPKCDPNNKWNRPCQKKLNSKEYAELKKLAKALIQHKSSWPFLEPVDQCEVPDYYKVVKEPMDLKTIDGKVVQGNYANLSKFVADVMLVFDNCRAYNPPNSSFCTCAQALESFFCQRLKPFKVKLAASSSSSSLK